MSYVTKSIYFANCLEKGKFIEMVRQSVPLYEQDTDRNLRPVNILVILKAAYTHPNND